MFEDLQLQPPEKKRELSTTIICVYLETLILLTTTKEGRDKLRSRKAYPVIRELHKAILDDRVTILCEKLVNVLMRDEGPDVESVEIEAKKAESDDEMLVLD